MSLTLPLFPLHTVFFPRMVLPLHVFEPRYQLLVQYCQENMRPFGIVLIRSGQEVGGPAEPYDVGTRAEILRVTELEDGSKHIIVRGTERFVIRSLSHTQPYLVAEVDDYPLEAGDMDDTLVVRAEVLFFRYLRLFKEVEGLSISISNLPEDPEGIAWMIAWGLQVDLAKRQETLSLPSLNRILEFEEALLRREIDILEMLGSEEVQRRKPPEEMGTISPN